MSFDKKCTLMVVLFISAIVVSQGSLIGAAIVFVGCGVIFKDILDNLRH